MAVNTAERRYSMLNFGMGDIMPAPDGTVDKVDRATHIELYSGFDLDAGGVVAHLNSADIDLIFDELVTDNLTFRQVLQFLPHMDALMMQNKRQNITILDCLEAIKKSIKPLKGAIQDSDRNQLRGRGAKNGQ